MDIIDLSVLFLALANIKDLFKVFTIRQYQIQIARIVAIIPAMASNSHGKSLNGK